MLRCWRRQSFASRSLRNSRRSGGGSAARVAARLFAAAPDNGVRDGRRALTIAQALVNRQPRTIELAETLADGVEQAFEMIASGAARQKLDTFVSLTRKLTV